MDEVIYISVLALAYFQDCNCSIHWDTLVLLFTPVLTPWCGIFPEEYVVHKLAKNCPAITEPRSPFLHCVHESTSLNPTLSKFRSVHPATRFFRMNHFNHILPPKPMLSKRFPRLTLYDQNVVWGYLLVLNGSDDGVRIILRITGFLDFVHRPVF
jgi:hypothetical protein